MIEGEVIMNVSEPEFNYELKVGSQVIVKAPFFRGGVSGIQPGMTGTVRVISTLCASHAKPSVKYGVEFDAPIHGHSCGGAIENNRGFYMLATELLLLVPLEDYFIEEPEQEPCTDEELLDFLGIT